jgi:hypothetical protein
MQTLEKNSKKKYIKIIPIILIIIIYSLFFSFCHPQSNVVNKLESSYNFPNPFCPTCGISDKESTIIRAIFVNYSETTKVDLSLSVSDISGSLVWYYNREIDISNTADGSKTNIDVIWAGNNNDGETVSQGIYNATINIQSIESNIGYGGDTLSSIVKIAVE